MLGAAVLRAALRVPLPRTVAAGPAGRCRCSAAVRSAPPPAPPGAPSPAWVSSPVRSLQLCSASCAGHNKWSKVKHIKGPKDEARGKMINKLGMMMKIAVKEGGANPDLNINLAHILEQCRNKNMPKASIEAVLKSAEKAKPASQHMFEARGPGGCVLLIEVLSDNITRTHQDMKHLMNKKGGTLSDRVRHNFTRKGVVGAPGGNISTERALELAIEAGAEDVQETEDEEEQPLLKFICDTMDLTKVRASLEELGVNVTSSAMEFFPCILLSLDQDQLEAASTLVEALNDFPDVVRVWDNIQADS